MGVAVWLLLFCSLNACVIWSDFFRRRVFNRLLLLAFALQVVWLLVCWVAPPDLTAWGPGLMATRASPALVAAALALVFLFPLWRFRAMGAGDVKFAACLGFCLGLVGLASAFLLACLLAGVHSVLYYLQRGFPGLFLRFGGLDIPRSTPFAAYLALAVLFGLGWQGLHGRPWLSALIAGA